MIATSPSLTEQLQARLNAVIMFPSGAMSMPHVHVNPPADVSDDSSRSENGSIYDARSSQKESASTYRDFSHVLPDKHLQASSLIAQSMSITSKEPTFPVKLHLILSNPEFEDIIAWLPHGRSWRILQQKAFEDRVIPLYFRHGRYSSFARQVNGWGFGRVTRGSDYNSYYHELFLRGMPHLCERMRRLTSKDMSKKKKIQVVEESAAPDFHAISLKKPLSDNAPATRRNANNQTAAPIFSHPSSIVAPPSPVLGVSSNLSRSAEAELVLLERFRSDIQKRMSSIVYNNNSFQNNVFQNNKMDAAANLSATNMMAIQNLGRMFNPKPAPTANDTALLLKRQMLASLLGQTDISKLLSLAVAGNNSNNNRCAW